MIINPYCKDLGWLFEDLKRGFYDVVPYSFAGSLGVDVVATERPAPTGPDLRMYESPIHIALRSWEITGATPHPERTIVQFHSLEPSHAGDPKILDFCAAFVFVHPDQPAMLERLGVSLDKPCILRPIGAPAGLRLRKSLPDKFTVGWAGRDTGAKRIELFVDACNKLYQRGVEVRASMIGANLEAAHGKLRCESILIPRTAQQPYDLATYQRFYDDLDVLCITSAQETGPMPLFEAKACGVPTYGDPTVGWQGILSARCSKYHDGDPLVWAAENREHQFSYRRLARASLMGFTLESWIEDNVRLAMEVADG